LIADLERPAAPNLLSDRGEDGGRHRRAGVEEEGAGDDADGGDANPAGRVYDPLETRRCATSFGAIDSADR
jgi:hypothetical protein